MYIYIYDISSLRVNLSNGGEWLASCPGHSTQKERVTRAPNSHWIGN